MKFYPENCVNRYFIEHMLGKKGNYGYFWCKTDADVHTHVDFYELFFTCDDFCHWHEGQEERAGKGVMYFFAPGEKHGLGRATKEGVCFNFFARVDFFERFFEENAFLRNVITKGTYRSCKLTDVEYEYLYKLASMLMHQNNEYQRVSLFLYNAISLLILHNEMEQSAVENNFVFDLVEKMNNFTFLTEKVQEIYSLYPIARCTLIKDFKRYTGMTIAQYQKKQKLCYAVQLLLNSKYQITEIAEKVGYDSLSHFLRVFKEEYGQTPKEYKKRRIQET